MLLCCLLSTGHALRHLFKINYAAIHDAKHKKLTINANFKVYFSTASTVQRFRIDLTVHVKACKKFRIQLSKYYMHANVPS